MSFLFVLGSYQIVLLSHISNGIEIFHDCEFFLNISICFFAQTSVHAESFQSNWIQEPDVDLLGIKERSPVDFLRQKKSAATTGEESVG